MPYELNSRALLAGVVALAAFASALPAQMPAPAPAPAGDLIPRALIFGNPSRSGAQVSPDGRNVAWLAPVDGVMNIWVAPVGDLAAAKAVTGERKRGLANYAWAPDGQHLLFLNDEGGNENDHVFAVSATGGATRDLTPVGPKVRAQIQGVSPLKPGVVLIGLNDRDPQYFDLYEVDYRTGAKTKVFENPGYGDLVTDNQLRVRFGAKTTPGGGQAYFRRETDGSWKEAVAFGNEDAFTTGPRGFDRDGKTMYWADSRGRDKAALVAMDVATLKTTVLAASDKADVQNVLTDPMTFKPLAYSVNYLRTEWTPLDPAAKADLDFLKSKLKGELSITSISDDGRYATVTANSAEQPVVAYLYDRKGRTLAKLFESRPDLSRYRLRAMQPVEVKAKDGLTLVSYLTLPADADPDGDGRPNRPVPMVLYVHGGPWARDSYGYNSMHQFLANRGYAVMSVNYRSSTGFGKGFVNAGVGEWSGKMHQDLLDAVDYAVKAGVTTPDKVAIMGGSYGGYATLVGVTFTPDRFACGVDIVGPSNLKTLMESFPAYWRPSLEGNFYKHIGDPAKASDVPRMMAQSPISRVDAIKVPLLIGQGQNDPRVVKAESDQIVEAMRAKKLPVTYVNFTDEGHGFQRPENRLAFFSITEGFLAQCLKGRAEPIGDAFKGSSIEVLEGAQFVPGVSAALPKAGATGH